jgi:hypothetical protein
MILFLLAALLAQPKIEPSKPQAPSGPAPAKPSGPQLDDDGIEIAGASAGTVRVPSSDSAWGGIRTGQEPELSQRVADYNLEAVLDPDKHTIEGKSRLTWRNRSDRAVKHLYLHLYLNGFEGPGSTFMSEKQRYGGFRSDIEMKKGEFGYIELKKVEQGGKPVPWTFVHPDGGPETDHSVVRLDLPIAVLPGSAAVVDMEFHDQLPRVVARTGYFDKYHFVAQWFPKLGVLELPGERGATRPRWNCHEFHHNSEFYADFGSYRADITIPKGYTLGSTGTEIGPPQETPKGMRHRIEQDDVHDFAFTAWDKFAPPLEGKWKDVRVKVLYPPEYVDSARDTLQATIDSLDYFSRTLGEYPYKQVTAVVPPYNASESGGMEYETFFTSVGGLGPPFKQFARYVTVHEFGHGYFMGLLASNEFEEPFLDEGLNEFWDVRMQSAEVFQVPAPGILGRLGIGTPRISWWDFERTGTSRYQADPIAGNAWDRYSRGSYGLIYARTVLVLHDLEQRLGGDVLARGFKEYYRRWHHRHPSAADFQKALEDVAGEQAPLVRRWFEEQVYGRAPVDDRVDLLETAEILPEAGIFLQRDGTRAERTPEEAKKQIKEAREAFRKAHPDAKPSEPGPFPWRSIVQVRRYAAQVPQTLTVKFEDGAVETIPWPEDERWHRYVFERPVQVQSVQLDPERNWLLDLNKLDDGRTREASRKAGRRWTLELKAWTELALAMLEAL